MCNITPETYHPTIQTVETTMKVMGSQILPNDLIAIFLQEAEHRTIETCQAKQVDTAMSASSGVKEQSKKNGKGKGKGKSHTMCDHCHQSNHSKHQFCAPGGDKEGQGLNQQKAKNKMNQLISLRMMMQMNCLHFHAPLILMLLRLN
jgi:hypothetical protein